MGYYSSFVVKIWADDDGKMSRGYVQHVSTEESMHFLTLDQMVAFSVRRQTILLLWREP